MLQLALKVFMGNTRLLVVDRVESQATMLTAIDAEQSTTVGRLLHELRAPRGTQLVKDRLADGEKACINSLQQA